MKSLVDREDDTDRYLASQPLVERRETARVLFPSCSLVFLYKHVLHTRVARSQGGDDRQRERETERTILLSLYVCAKKIGRLLVEWEGSDAIFLSLSLSLLLPANKIDRIQKRCYEKSFPRKRRERASEQARGTGEEEKSERRRTHTHRHTFTSTHGRTIFTLNQSKSGNLYQPIQSKLLNMSGTTNTSKTFVDGCARDNATVAVACQRKEDINRIDFR